MRRLPKAGVVLLALLMAFGGLGALTGWGPAAYAQGGGAFFEAVARALILAGALHSTTGDVKELFGLSGNPDQAELEKALKDLTRELQERFKEEQALYEIIHNRPWELVRFLAELTQQQKLSLDNVALEEYLATTGVSDTDIRGYASAAATVNRGKSGDVIFDAAASALRSDQQVDWADEFVAQRMLQAYLDGRDGLTRDQLTVKAIQAADDSQIKNIEAAINALSGELGVDMVALLREALRRVRASWLPSLARQVDQLTAALAQANRQLDTIQGELEELKQRRDPLSFWLALAALVLAVGALGMVTLRRRAA